MFKLVITLSQMDLFYVLLLLRRRPLSSSSSSAAATPTPDSNQLFYDTIPIPLALQQQLLSKEKAGAFFPAHLLGPCPNALLFISAKLGSVEWMFIQEERERSCCCQNIKQEEIVPSERFQ